MKKAILTFCLLLLTAGLLQAELVWQELQLVEVSSSGSTNVIKGLKL